MEYFDGTIRKYLNLDEIGHASELLHLFKKQSII